MPSSPIIKVVEHLRKTIRLGGEAHLSDGQLLTRYLEHRDEVAFAAIVRRHGPMVWGVCLRLAGRDDAEDAFQATFLILVRKASAIRAREAVANWLYGVASHAALKARTASARVRAREKQVTSMPDPAQEERDDREVQRLLDQELGALPDKYRLPVVLCDLEGRSRKEVASQLKIPEGTLSSRLTTAHRMLAKRLGRHGLAVSGASLAALLAQNAASAGVPAAVVATTIKTAALVAAGKGAVAGVASTKVAALTDGVLKAMLLSQIKTMTAVMLVFALVAMGGGQLLTHYSEAAQKVQTPKPAADQKDGVNPTKSKVDPLKTAQLFRYLTNCWRSEREKLVQGKVQMTGYAGGHQEKSEINVSLTFDHLRRAKRYYLDWKNWSSGWWQTTPEGFVTCADNGASVVSLRNATDQKPPYVIEFDPRCIGAGLFHDLIDGTPLDTVAKQLNEVSGSGWQLRNQKDGVIEFQSETRGAAEGVVFKTIIVINDKKGFTVEKFETFFKGESERNWSPSSRVESQWQEITNVWVPVHVAGESYTSGRVMELSLAWAQVNRPFLDDEFKLDNLGPPPGTPVADLRSTPTAPMLVGRIGHESLPAKTIPSGSNSLQMRTVVIVAVNLCVIITFVFLYIRRKRAAAKN